MNSVRLSSFSRAEDAGYLAVLDVANVAARLGADYRLVGGQMVSLLVAVHHVSGVPERQTNDADLGADFAVLADPLLIDALTELCYSRPGAANRFVRAIDVGLSSVIDVLGPSYTGSTYRTSGTAISWSTRSQGSATPSQQTPSSSRSRPGSWRAAP